MRGEVWSLSAAQCQSAPLVFARREKWTQTALQRTHSSHEGLGGAAAVFIMRGDKRKHLPVFVKSNTAIPPGDDSSQYPTLLVLTFQVPNPISYSINKRDILAAVAPGWDVSSPAGVEVCGVCRRAGGSRGAGLQACSAAGRMYPPPSRPDTGRTATH